MPAADPTTAGSPADPASVGAEPSAAASGETLARPLDALLELARMPRGRSLDEVLVAVADAVAVAVAYQTVVINLYRPAWDDYEVVLVRGSDDARAVLLGSTETREAWNVLLDCAYARGGACFLPGGEFTWPQTSAVYTPDLAVSTDPEAWRREDALLVPLHADGGAPLGILSVDEPRSGRRPSDADLEILVAVCAHASVALEHAQSAAAAAAHRMILADLLRVSARLARGISATDVLEEVCAAVAPGLGFEKAAVLLRSGQTLRVRAARGFESEPELLAQAWSVSLWESLLESRFERDGCQLVGSEDAGSLIPPAAQLHSSRRNGRGPRAWCSHWLFVPLRDNDDELVGVLLADDPVDRLLPDRERLQALRLLADQAAAGLESAQRLERLRYLASHDPLTGIRNRRDLQRLVDEALLASAVSLSVLVCDLDRFKTVNDRLGHDVGDQVLERFGALLREHARDQDVPVRLGGEEFCVLLPATGTDGALVAAERLRRATRQVLAEFAPGLSVSIGVASSGPALNDAQRLLGAADSALYAAKAAGRDRCVVHAPVPPA